MKVHRWMWKNMKLNLKMYQRVGVLNRVRWAFVSCLDMSLTMLSRSLSGCIKFNCNSCHYEVDGNTTLSDHMHLFHKQYNLFLTGILNLRILNYSENQFGKKMQKVFLIVMVKLNRKKINVINALMKQWQKQLKLL